MKNFEEKEENIVKPESKLIAEDLTPQQKCEQAHQGECGSCDEEGNFTPCT